MKKTLLAGLTIALLASLASTACGKKEELAAPKPADAPAAAAAGAAPSHAPADPGTGAQVPAAPSAEAIAGKQPPADAVHGGAAKPADPHAGLQAPQVAPGTGRKGKVVETMNASSYTYIKVDENGKGVWLAVMQQPIKVGQTIEFPNVPPMTNFTSKTLNRTFDAILFVPSIRVE